MVSPNFTRPNIGRRYSGPEYHEVAVTRLENTDGHKICVTLGGAGMGGAKPKRKEVVPWDEFISLSEDKRRGVINDYSLVVRPPEEWVESVLTKCRVFLNPSDTDIVSEGWRNYKDVDWKIPEYHDITSWQDEDKPVDEEYTVMTEEIEIGEVYLVKSTGEVAVYAGDKESATEVRLNDVEFNIFDIDNIQILPFEDAFEMDDEDVHNYEEDDSVWVQTAAPEGGGLEKHIHIFLRTAEGNPVPYSIRKKWLKFHKRMEGMSRIKYKARETILNILIRILE